MKRRYGPKTSRKTAEEIREHILMLLTLEPRAWDAIQPDLTDGAPWRNASFLRLLHIACHESTVRKN